MIKRRKILIVVMAVALIVPAAAALADAGPDAAAIYKAKCAMCHGPDGAGQTTMGKSMKLRDLGSADVQKQTDAELTKWIADGKGKMPAYKSKLSAAEIGALVDLIRTFKN